MYQETDWPEGFGPRGGMRRRRPLMLMMPFFMFTPIVWSFMIWRKVKRLEREIAGLRLAEGVAARREDG